MADQLLLRIAIIEKNDRGQEVEMVRKTMKFHQQATVLDACAQIRERLTEIKGLGNPVQYGLFLTDEDPKKGVWLDPNRTLEHYLLRDNDPLEYRKKFRLLKVRMLDGTVKSLMVDDSQTVANMMVLICTKIGITNYDEYSLVWDKPDEEQENIPTNRFGTLGGTMTLRRSKIRDGEKEIDPKMEELKKILNTEDGVNWVDHSKTLREQGIVETEVLLLKRKYFYSDANIDSRDPVQLNLLYEQAREAILDGTHPVRQDDAVAFAALQVQIQFGDHREQTHRPGILDLKEFLPQSYLRANKIEKKIFQEHKNNQGVSEVDAKVKYVKLARGLPTFGVHFFLVKEKMKGRNRLVPRLLGVTKDSVLRLDEKTKEILKTWPLTTVRRWVASPNVFTLDFGDYQDQYYSVQTTEGEQISQLIAGYIDIILKRRQRKERFGDDGNEEEAMEEDIVTPGRAITMVGLPGGMQKKAETSSLAKPGVLRNSGGASSFEMSKNETSRQYMSSSQRNGADGGVAFNGARHAEELSLSGPQRALVSTISHGQESIHRAENMLQEKAKLPTLGDDPASCRWKETQKSTSKQSIHSQVSAMNAATAQMVTLTGQGHEADHSAVGAAVNTISNNLPEMAKGVQMLAALMDDEGSNGDDLMGAAKHLCSAFSELLAATEPTDSKRPRQSMLTAASQVGSASHRVLYTIGEDELMTDKDRQDGLLGLAKAVANNTAALVLKAKNVASRCEDQGTQNRVIGAATQCALCTSQLVACAKVVAPTISDPTCQDQLVESAKEVARSVEGCVRTCRDVGRDDQALRELGVSAGDVTRALNELLNHVRDGHVDRIPDIMEQIMTASGEIIASSSSSEMVRQARILAQSTAELIQAIKGEAESTTDSDLQKRLLSAAKELAEATARMVEATKCCASNPNDRESQEALRRAAESLRNTTHAAVSATMKRKTMKRLENASKHAAAAATQCIAASQGAQSHNTNRVGQEQLMDACKAVADVIPSLVEGVRMSVQRQDSTSAQMNLINNGRSFLEPSVRLAQSTRSALPTVADQSASLQLAHSSRQLENSLRDLKQCVGRAQQICGGGSVQIEAASGIIEDLRAELEEFRAGHSRLRPLPGETAESTRLHMSAATKAVGSKVTQLLGAASSSSSEQTTAAAAAARDAADSLRNYVEAVRGVAATAKDRGAQDRIIDMAQVVMQKSAVLVLEAQRKLNNKSNMEALHTAGRAVTTALEDAMSCLPGQEEVDRAIGGVGSWFERIEGGSFSASGRSYGELQGHLSKAANRLNLAASTVVQTATRPERIAETSRGFEQELQEVMECSMDMAGQTVSTRSEIVAAMRNLVSSSSTLLSSAKDVAADPSEPRAKNNLAQGARGVAESINDLVDVCTSAAPGQNECDNAVRAIQSSRHVLENAAIQPVNNMTYYECLDAVMAKSKALGDGMTGIANHAKKSEHEEFGRSVKHVSGAICGLVEAAAQSAYLVGVSDPSSVSGRSGLVDQSQFVMAAQAIRSACQALRNPNSGQQEVLSSATVIAKHTNVLCNACRHASSNTDDPSAKRQFVQSAKEVANSTATLVKEIKNLDSNYSDANRRKCAEATGPLLQSVDALVRFASSPDFSSLPGRISGEGRNAQRPILEASHFIVDGSCTMIHSAKSLAVNSKDPPTWQALANSSKAVSDSIKKLVSSIRDRAPGQRECDEAIEALTTVIRDLDGASLAAINQNLEPNGEKEVKYFTEQMERAAVEIGRKVEEVKSSSKSEAERLGREVKDLASLFDPLVANAIGFASNMVSSKQQVLVLDQTKTVAECAQQMLYAAKESGGNPKAVHVHADVDETAEATKGSVYELLASIEKLAPNMGVVSRIVKCITEAIFQVDDYRPGSRQGQEDSFVLFQTSMMNSTKEIARTAQDIVIKSSNEPDRLGNLATHISTCYQQLASDAKRASQGAADEEIGQRIRVSVQELGQATIELVKATGSCQAAPKDSHILRDVTENARSVGEKCSDVLHALNAANTGTHALENAASTVSGILGDLDTTIMFATAGTLNADEDNEAFSDHRENILKTAKALVEDTKTLVAGAASSQEQLAVAAQNAVTTIVQLSEVVKSGAASLGSPNREAQVMLINSVKDVASALSDLMHSTKAASGKSIQDPAMHHLKDSAKIMVTNVTSLLKTVKAVEDEHSRGTRALESSIEAIAQEIRSFDSPDAPRNKAEPEDLVRATRPITLATGKAVSAGKSLKQEDIIVAANMGRKAISDMLSTCKAASFASEKRESRQRALGAGRAVAVQYRELLQLVMGNLGKPTAEGKQQLGSISRNIAQCVTELANAAESLKDDDWVDPSDPTFIAENELLGAAKSIDIAASKLASLKPRKEIKGKEVDPNTLNFDELILDAAKSIAAATSALIKAASEAQRELVAQGKVQKMSNINSEDGQWSEGLVSAAKMVAAATHNLCEAANALVKGHSAEEKLIAAAQQVAGSTAQLLLACKVKADPESGSMRRLEAASNAVRKAADNLVKAAQQALDQEEELHNMELNKSAVNSVVEQINARSEVLKMERQLEHARGRLEKLNQRKYQTDSETEQSGYESSGYDDSFFRKTYNNSPFQQSPRPAWLSSPNESSSEARPQHTIESGPSFNESMERFRSATTGSGTESDGAVVVVTDYKQSTVKQHKRSTTVEKHQQQRT